MASKNFVQNVEKLFKTTCKTPCKIDEKKCVKNINVLFFVYNTYLSSNYSNIFHHIFHNSSPLLNNYFFHYSTDPTITTIK